MSALDRIEDYGERIGSDGEPVDEFLEVLICMPLDGDNPEIIMLAAAIANYRCNGKGNIAAALRRWQPEAMQ